MIFFIIVERLLNPIIDLVSTLSTSESPSQRVVVLGIIGIIAIIAASILGLILMQRAVRWLRTANHALQIAQTGQYPSIDPSKRIQVRGKTFENQDVNLDGHTWMSCNFINCNIILERGDFDAIGCTFIRCHVTAQKGAIAILRFAKEFEDSIRKEKEKREGTAQG